MSIYYTCTVETTGIEYELVEEVFSKSFVVDGYHDSCSGIKMTGYMSSSPSIEKRFEAILKELKDRAENAPIKFIFRDEDGDITIFSNP